MRKKKKIGPHCQIDDVTHSNRQGVDADDCELGCAGIRVLIMLMQQSFLLGKVF